MPARFPSPATCISLVALFVALGGTGYAVTQIDKNSVGTKQLKKDAVTSPKVKDGTLQAGDFAPGQLPAGATGATGLQGPKGDVGAKGDTGTKGDTGEQGPPGPSTGTAGGDLTGSYPNPTLAAGVVGADELAGGAVTPAKVSGVPTVGLIGVNQSIPDDSVTPINFTTTLWDPMNMHPGGGQNSQVSAPVAGVYQVCAQVAWTANPTGRRIIFMEIKRSPTFSNESGSPGGSHEVTPSAGVVHNENCAQLALETNDRVAVNAYQNSGGALSLVNYENGTPGLQMTWIAPDPTP